MTQLEPLLTWEGVLTSTDLDGLLERVTEAVFIGQRPGDFALARGLKGVAAAWPSGRCFNEELEIRWWASDSDNERGVLILGRLPDGWLAPNGWEHSHDLAHASEPVSFLCVGQYDGAAAKGVHQWWEPRYGRAFQYLDSAPPAQSVDKAAKTADPQGRVHLVTMRYELADGRTHHRLMRFEFAKRAQQDGAP